MIYLERDKVNKIALTLNESNMSGTSSFIFEFVREWDLQVFSYSYSNISIQTLRYDLFNIELSASASNIQSSINGVVDMEGGQYTYRIYDGLDIIETGKAVVEIIIGEQSSVNSTDPENLYD